MIKTLLAAGVVTGFFTLLTPHVSAATAESLNKASAQSVAKVDFRWNGHHWHHRMMRHGHWHYWN
jgi:hypothetical protein